MAPTSTESPTPSHGRSASSQPRPRLAAMLVLLVAIALGLYFRFTRLDGKFFWLDEAHSQASAAGHSMQEIDGLFDGTPRRLVDLQSFLRLRPDEPLSTTFEALRGTPENAPLYFTALRLWAETFGDSVAMLRAFSALMGVLGGVLMVLLCRELGFNRAATIGVVCWWALAPVLVLYSQEARTYSLLSVEVVLANLLLLRALRLSTWTNWLGYAFVGATGLYTHMFFGLLLAAHAIYVATMGVCYSSAAERRRTFLRFGCAAVGIVAAFVPWIVVLVRYDDRAVFATISSSRPEFQFLLQSWTEGLATTLVDLGLHGSVSMRAANIAIAIAALGILGWSARYIARHAPPRTSLFLLSTSCLPPLAFIGCDLVFGGTRSEFMRFWIPSVVSFGLMFGYAIAIRCAAGSRRAMIVGLSVFVAAAVSCARSAEAPTWWSKGTSVSRLDLQLGELKMMRAHLAEIAAVPRPLLIVAQGRFNAFQLLAISRHAAPHVEWLGIDDAHDFEPPRDRAIFLYRAPNLLQRLAERGWSVEGVEPPWEFHRIRPDSPTSDR